jgi:RND family efflux transporter MFP subunit
MNDLATNRLTALESRRPVAPATRTGRRGIALWPAVIAVVAVAGLGGALTAGIVPRWQRHEELSAAATEVATRLPRVTVATARTVAATTERVLPGSSQPLQEAAIYARTTGYLQARHVDIGDRVTKDQLLAEIATPEVDAQLEHARAVIIQTKANLARDQANEALASADLDRSLALFNSKAVSRQDFDAAVATARAATATTKATEATLKVNEADVKRLDVLQAFQKVTAPFAGVITAKNVDPGALVSADSPNGARELFHLVQMDTLRVLVNVPQVHATEVKVGQKAVVFRREDPRRTFEGTVTRTADALDTATRSLLTEVQVPNRDELLRPGMYLQVKFVFQRNVPTVLVPTAALVTRTGGPRVAVLDHENRVRYRTVELGRDHGIETEVLGGVSAGEAVVVHPGDDLPEAMAVEPVRPTS